MKMDRFLILSECGDGVGLALRLRAEGHEAKIKIFDSQFENQGNGIVDFAHEYSSGQTVIADVTGFGQILDLFKGEGVRTFAGSSFADKLEKDRGFSESIFKKVDIEVPEAISATSWSDAAKAIQKIASKSGKVVVKPEGSLSGVVPSFVAHDEAEALSMLQQFEKEHGSSEVALTIQEFIKGVSLSTEGWFNGKEWIEGMFNHTIERKQFLNEDLGPSGGCTGNVVWSCDSKDPTVRETLLKLTDVLQEHVYIGPIDINCVVNKSGIYALEFTPRFGYDAFPTLLYSLCDFDFGNFIDDLTRGDSSGEHLFPGFAAGVRLSLPPWPSEQFKHDGGVEIRGLDEASKEWFYPFGIQLIEGELRSSHGVGILGVVNGRGDSIGEAFARAYDIVASVRAPDLQYRTDLAKVCLKDYRELQQILGEHNGEWIGVDFDATLATYGGWSAELGEPIQKMVQRVKRWISEGKEVRLFTARGSIEGEGESSKYKQLVKMYNWLEEHIGEPIEITHEKDPMMIRLYDDRVVQVEANEGSLVN